LNGQFKGLAAIFLAACIWGLSGPYFRWLGSHGIGIFLNNVVGCSAAAAALAIIGLLAGVPFWKIRLRHTAALVPHAAMGVVTNYTMFTAFALTTVANTVLLHYMTPIFVAVLSVPLFGERLTVPKVAALFTSMAGMTLVVSAGSPLLDLNIGRGEALAFASSLSYTVSIIAGKYLQSLHPLAATFWNNVFLVVFSGACLAASPQAMPEPWTLGVVAIGSGMIGAVASVMLYFYALKNADASKVSIVALTEVAVGSILGVILFREPLSLPVALGGAMILAGCVIVAARRDE
jgi:drug/metabolite transporter (DMT)-like permease